MEKKSIEIRDLRHQDWLWTSKQLLFHDQIDGNSYKVYGGLAAYANNTTQEAFPSIDTLSEKLHLSRNTVIKSLANLDKTGFIKIEKTTGEHNVYILLSVTGAQVLKPKEETKNEPKEKEPVPPMSDATKPSLFERFWAIYPNKANKKVAEKKFAKLSNKTIQTMVIDVKRRKEEHDQWLKGYIPHLATYINQERWNDPIVKPSGEKVHTTDFIHPSIRKKLKYVRVGDVVRQVPDDYDENAYSAGKSIGEILKA